MRRGDWILGTSLFLIALISIFLWKNGRPANSSSTAQISILADTPPQEVQHVWTKGKRRPAVEKRGSGEIVFYTRLQEDPTLHVSVKASPAANARLLVDSDYPDGIHRSYPAPANTPVTISLKDFENRVVRITLVASGSEPVLWVDPFIRQHSVIPAKVSLDPFRSRLQNDNVLIFVFDAASPYHFSSFGYAKKTTPGIDSIASQGVLWENVISSAPFTTPSTAALFTGLYPEATGVLRESDVLPRQYKTIAECFRDSGYETASFSGNPNASTVRGFGQGFKTTWARLNIYVTNAAEVTSAVNSWLSKIGKRRFFGYVHFREPHLPYSPPQEFLIRFGVPGPLPAYDKTITPDENVRRQIISAYDANLAFADAQFQKIIDHLQRLGLLKRTILLLLSDHGEAFWEHGVQGHGQQTYDEMIRIPLVMHFPDEPELKGKRLTALAGNIDITPTLLDLFGLSSKNMRTDGRSLLPLLFGVSEPQRFILSRSSGPHPAYSLRGAEFKYIQYDPSDHGSSELYLIKRDRFERINVANDYPVLAGFCRMQLRKMLQEIRASALEIPDREHQKTLLNEEVKEQLRSLGYVQ